MVADGVLKEGDAGRIMATIVQVATEQAPALDPRGLRMRLVWSARDARNARVLQRDNIETAVRWAMRPLIQIRASKEATLAAGHKAAGDLLTAEQIRAIAADEWNKAQRRGRK